MIEGGSQLWWCMAGVSFPPETCIRIFLLMAVFIHTLSNNLSEIHNHNWQFYTRYCTVIEKRGFPRMALSFLLVQLHFNLIYETCMRTSVYQSWALRFMTLGIENQLFHCQHSTEAEFMHVHFVDVYDIILRVLVYDIILRVLRLEVSVYNVYVTDQRPNSWDKSLKCFPPCYSQSPLLMDFTPPPPAPSKGYRDILYTNILYT